MTTEDRLARDRLAELADALDAVPTEVEVGAAVALVQTATEAVYPSANGVYFYCQILALSGTEAEGGSGSTAGAGACIYAFNVGSTKPPDGTRLVAVQPGDRWLVSYNG